MLRSTVQKRKAYFRATRGARTDRTSHATVHIWEPGTLYFVEMYALHRVHSSATELNHFGGEDSEFFRRLVDRRVGLTWAADALVVEHVPSQGWIPSDLPASVPEWTSAVISLALDPVGFAHWGGLLGWRQVLHRSFYLDCFQSCVRRISVTNVRRIFGSKTGGLGKVLWMRLFWIASCDNSV